MKAELSKQLRGDEAVRPCVYKDSLGFYTIAVGRLVDDRKNGAGLRDDEITYLLNNDIDDRINAIGKVLPWSQRLDDARQGVLLNMAFNMGTDRLLQFKHTLDLVQRADYDGAAKEMLNSLWAKQVGDRSKRLSAQMRDGQWRYA